MVKKTEEPRQPRILYTCSFCGADLCHDNEEYANEHETYECEKNPKRKDRPHHQVYGGYALYYVTLTCCRCKKNFEVESDSTRYATLDHDKKRKCPHCKRTTTLLEDDVYDIDMG